MLSKRILFAICTALLTFASVARADWVLIPVGFFGEMPGAYGSRWVVRLTAYNDFSLRNRIAMGECRLASCPREYAEPFSTFEFPFQLPASAGLGHFIDVTWPEHLTFHYRTRDLSRQSETAGTQLPILHERDGIDQKIHLMSIPVEERFRIMLRLYGLDGEDQVEVTINDAQTGGELWSGPIPLLLSAYNPPRYVPAQAQVPDVASLLGGFRGEIRITVEASPGKRIWGFATITHNETQHVTVVEAQ